MSTEVRVYPAPQDGKTIAIVESRTGTALPLKEPNVIKLSGNIESIANFLKNRNIIKTIHKEGEETMDKDIEKEIIENAGLQIVNADRAVLIVDREKGSIELQLDPQNFYGPTVFGQLEEAPELDVFCVNESEYYSREQMIKLLRFNRLWFPNQEKHAELLASFQKFSVNAYVNLEKESDMRGNVQALFSQVVNSKIPLSFILETPIYKGQPKEKYLVDICIDLQGSNVKFFFESVELVELLKTRKDEIISKQLESCTAFPVIFK